MGGELALELVVRAVGQVQEVVLKMSGGKPEPVLVSLAVSWIAVSQVWGLDTLVELAEKMSKTAE